MTEYSVQRQHQRHRVALRVELESGPALTRDISLGGIYFETQMPIEAGSAIAFRLVLEQLTHGPLRIDCEGTVVRVDQRDDGFGVGATIERFESIGALLMSSPFRAHND